MKTTITTVAMSLLLSGALLAQTPVPPGPTSAAKDARIILPGSPLGVAAGFLYGYQGVKPYTFMPQLRQLGGDFTKIYLFWNQIEPEKSKYDWTAVDKFVDQLRSPEEGLIAIFSSSQWAVKRPSAMLPPSPAKNSDDYYRFIFDLVKHCKGRVRYWQNDSEPNNPIYWSGTKQEFVDQLKIFFKAVKDADPGATVVVGGYDGLFGPPGTHQFPGQQAGLDFFDYVLKEGRDAFDIFDLRLYGDPYTIVPRVEFMRQKMNALGYDKPIVCTEYGGPNLFEFPENRKYIALVSSWSTAMAKGDTKGPEPGKNPLEELYRNMSTLAPQTQMFMQGCSPELDAKYQRIQARGLVMRNLLALSAGVQKMLYWYLPVLPASRPEERYNIMSLMYGKIGMLALQDGELKTRTATAEAFERMASALTGVEQVRRIPLADKPSIYLFEVSRDKRAPLYVVWEQRDAFTGEDAPATPFDWTWTAKSSKAVDALGQVVPVKAANHQIHLSLSLTPVFIEPDR